MKNSSTCKTITATRQTETVRLYIAAEALLDELEAETRYREGAFIACNRWHDKFREADDKLEAAERRIAELESKLSNPVLLPKTNGYWNEQEKAYEEAITLAKRQVRLAGFSVEDM